MEQKWKWKMKARRTSMNDAMEGKITPLGW